MNRSLAYRRGRDAVQRVGEFAGATTVPACPYRQGTPEFYEWLDGSADALAVQLALIREGKDPMIGFHVIPADEVDPADIFEVKLVTSAAEMTGGFPPAAQDPFGIEIDPFG